jgi:hypothetical protein
MAKRKKRGQNSRSSASRPRRPTAPLKPADQHLKARSRAIALARTRPATPLRRRGAGWVLEPRGVPPILFLPRFTQFEQPSEAECGAVDGANGVVRRGARILEVRANSFAERRLVETRLRGRQDPAPIGRNTERPMRSRTLIVPPPSPDARAVQLLQANGIRTLDTPAGPVLLDDLKCRLAHNTQGNLMLVPDGSGSITFLPETTRFARASAAELEALSGEVTVSGEFADAPAGSRPEAEFVALRVAPLVADLADRKAAWQRGQAELRDAGEQRRRALQVQFAGIVDGLRGIGAPIALEDGELIYDEFAFGSPDVEGDRVLLSLVGGRLRLDPARDPSKFLEDIQVVAGGLRAVGLDLEQLGIGHSYSREGLCINGTCVARRRRWSARSGCRHWPIWLGRARSTRSARAQSLDVPRTRGGRGRLAERCPPLS